MFYWRLWASCKGRCVIVIVTVASPTANLCSDSWRQAQRRKNWAVCVCVYVLRVMNGYCNIIDYCFRITDAQFFRLWWGYCCEDVSLGHQHSRRRALCWRSCCHRHSGRSSYYPGKHGADWPRCKFQCLVIYCNLRSTYIVLRISCSVRVEMH
jgi:hypothetical protein